MIPPAAHTQIEGEPFVLEITAQKDVDGPPTGQQGMVERHSGGVNQINLRKLRKNRMKKPAISPRFEKRVRRQMRTSKPVPPKAVNR